MTANPLAAIVTELRRFGIPHMLAGSFASAYHGDPRTTRDIDLVVDPTRDALERFVQGLEPERFYVSPEAAREAFRGADSLRGEVPGPAATRTRGGAARVPASPR